MRSMIGNIVSAGLSMAILAAAAQRTLGADEYVRDFQVNKGNLVSSGSNPYFPLEPGYRLYLKGGGGALQITVTHKTKLVDGVETRVVEEREEKNGRLEEVSQNYFAIDKTNNALYYFGEDVDIYKDGKIAGHEGAWLSGINGAKFGLMMPGDPKIGDKFQQEIAPGVAMDRCEIVAMGVEIATPARKFNDCLRVKDSSALENGISKKAYALGIGLIEDDEFTFERSAKTIATTKIKAAKRR